VRAAADRLAEAVALPCTVCEALADGSFLVVHTAHRVDDGVYLAPVGYRFPAGAAAQFKARLGWLAPAQQAEALEDWRPVRQTRTTIMDRGEMARDIAAARAWLCAQPGRVRRSFTTFALPIFDRAGEAVLVVSCAARAEVPPARAARVARALAAFAREIHAAIDGRPPVNFPAP